MKAKNSAVLPSTDRRSPFFVNVPSYEAKPIQHLVQYFKLWKQFISSLSAYLKDLVMAKEFDLNLNLQLIASVQFPGFKDLPYRCMRDLELLTNYASSTSQTPPKNEVNKTSVSHLAPTVSNDQKRPNLPRAKSATSFLKNQPFAHRRTTSSVTVDLDSSDQAPSKIVSGLKVPQPPIKAGGQAKGRPNGLSPQNSSPNVTLNILAAKVAPKSDVDIDPTYFPPDSLFMNMGAALVNNHLNIQQAQMKLCRDVTNRLIPNLEQLHRNLSIKIKEIKSLLKNDSFANVTLVKEVSKTGVCINDYINAVGRYLGSKPIIKQRTDQHDEHDSACLGDPFLAKLSLDHQLKSQLIHENYIFALYVNLQGISKDLLNYIIKDLNSVAEKMIKAMSAEAAYISSTEECLFNLGVTLKSKLKTLTYDWEYFMSHNKNFLNVYYDTPESPKRAIRSYKDIEYPYSNSIHSKCLRCGYIYRKQKLMKSYVSYFYVLTCNYLHEFKIENTEKKSDKKAQKGSTAQATKKKAKSKVGGVIDHEDTPVKSYNLNDFTIDIKDTNDLKFVLQRVSSNLKVSFKCLNEADFMAWSTDLQDLLKFSSNHLKRFKYVEDKLGKGTASQESASRESSSQQAVNGQSSQEMSLNLKNLLSDKASLDRILPNPNYLKGDFTPKVLSPNQQVTDSFDSVQFGTANEGQFSTTDRVISPAASIVNSPLASPELRPQTQQDLEAYLKLQSEIMVQQQKLMLIEADRQLSISRTSSEESMGSGLNTNNGLPYFLGQNQVYMNAIGKHHQTTESLSSLPEVLILDHGSNGNY